MVLRLFLLSAGFLISIHSEGVSCILIVVFYQMRIFMEYRPAVAGGGGGGGPPTLEDTVFWCLNCKILCRIHLYFPCGVFYRVFLHFFL